MSKRSIMKSIITITDAAANQIKYLLQRKQDPNIIGIHLSTKLRGCSGNSYVMNLCLKLIESVSHLFRFFSYSRTSDCISSIN